MDSNKRVILAVSLSLLVLLGWNFLFPPVPPVETAPQNQSAPVQAADQAFPSTAQAVPAAPTVQFTPAAGEKLTVDTPLYRAVINTAGGVLESFELKRYKETIEPGSSNIDLVTPQSVTKAPMGLIWNSLPTWAQGEWSVQGGDLNLAEGQSGFIQLSAVVGGVQIERVLTFTAGTYEVKEEVKVTNITEGQVQGHLAFSVSSVPLTAEDDSYNHTMIAYMAAGSLTEENSQKDLRVGVESQVPAQWGGIESNYFLLAIVPTSSDMFVRAKLEDNVYRMTVADQVLLDPGITQLRTVSYYFG
ncbi:MAG: membrane protein insertase YidC, partial [Desulfomicrobium sp.]|nr:membrane protein insertase YidC [Desulfomicrobium sp.]